METRWNALTPAQQAAFVRWFVENAAADAPPEPPPEPANSLRNRPPALDWSDTEVKAAERRLAMGQPVGGLARATVSPVPNKRMGQ